MEDEELARKFKEAKCVWTIADFNLAREHVSAIMFDAVYGNAFYVDEMFVVMFYELCLNVGAWNSSTKAMWINSLSVYIGQVYGARFISLPWVKAFRDIRNNLIHCPMDYRMQDFVSLVSELSEDRWLDLMWTVMRDEYKEDLSRAMYRHIVSLKSYEAVSLQKALIRLSEHTSWDTEYSSKRRYAGFLSKQEVKA